ncbi:MAG: hypothetical protein AUJ01_03245 [Acidobacteria bacterium 13_1_40CM_3_65_5]|jgi:hypothetical protein|nr:MAG: hypothetical protein AUJ01_03245 [Acidobacteria bacterium 13_1_40CM_3_65_5]OLE82377.1 MAG: hypothetical protein AUF76_09680 [Acidobacteria bacterium 13_1_20CM_2_65_9]
MSEAPDWRSSTAKRLQAKVISIVGYRLAALLTSTLRWRSEGDDHYDAVVSSGRQPIMAFWHGRILPATYYFRRRNIVVITSENFDGEWIAGIIERFGYGTARGSTSRGAKRALLRLKRDMAAGKPAAFTLDGPRGPARVAQPGAVWLAKATGNPILPFHIEADRYWTANSWDRTQIPKPYATAAIAIGEPLTVASDADEAEIERARQTLEQRLHELETRTRSMIESRD